MKRGCNKIQANFIPRIENSKKHEFVQSLKGVDSSWIGWTIGPNLLNAMVINRTLRSHEDN